MKLLHSDQLLNLTTNHNLARGQYSIFMLRYSGVAQAGITIALTDLGTIVLNWNGNDIVNVDVEVLSFLANEYGGFIEANSAVGAAFNFSVVIPCGEWWDSKNIYDISDTDKVYFKCDFPLLTIANIVSGTITIHGKPAIGIHSYFHKILSRQVVSGGAGALTGNIPTSNISQIYVKNPAALVGNMQYSIDNKVKADNDATILLAYSNWIHLLEATGTFLTLEFCPSKDLREIISQELTYNLVFTGAGTLAQYYSAIEFSKIKQDQSRNNLVR